MVNVYAEILTVSCNDGHLSVCSGYITECLPGLHFTARIKNRDLKKKN